MTDSTVQAVASLLSEATKIRDLAQSFLMPVKDSPESKDNERLAACAFAVEVVVSLVNVFTALRNPTPVNTEMVISDMVIGLNTNVFWIQKGGQLMPLLIAAVNADKDAKELKLRNESTWKDLEKQSANMWLEILPTIIFLTQGQYAMRAKSVEIKKAFASTLGIM